MASLRFCLTMLSLCLLSLLLNACATTSSSSGGKAGQNHTLYTAYNSSSFSSRLPQHISPPGEKVIIVNPQAHAWGAYGPDGNLVRGGLATAGSNWCPDLGRACHTRTGNFRIISLGSSSCKSTIFPMPNGGAPMPYCMYFNHGQALHGSPENEVMDGNMSHGCVRLHVQDAEWLRFNFVNVGTKVIIESY